MCPKKKRTSLERRNTDEEPAYLHCQFFWFPLQWMRVRHEIVISARRNHAESKLVVLQRAAKMKNNFLVVFRIIQHVQSDHFSPENQESAFFPADTREEKMRQAVASSLTWFWMSRRKRRARIRSEHPAHPAATETQTHPCAAPHRLSKHNVNCVKSVSVYNAIRAAPDSSETTVTNLFVLAQNRDGENLTPFKFCTAAHAQERVTHLNNAKKALCRWEKICRLIHIFSIHQLTECGRQNFLQ